MKLIIFFLIFISNVYGISTGCQSNPTCIACGPFPITKGQIVYHAYLNYGDGTSQIYLYKFNTNTTAQLSEPSWNIVDPMNAYFSPDGKKITFMGVQGGKWHVFLWTIGDANPPTNLTASFPDVGANEDPKFSTDGNSIYIKRGQDIKAIVLGTPNTLVDITNNGTATEESMPYAAPDGKSIYATQGAGAAMGVYQVNLNPLTYTACDAPGTIQTYYPVATDEGYLIYSQWRDAGRHNDQLVFKKTCTDPPLVLGFNDCLSENADAAPVNHDFVLFSGTQNATKYELFLGQISSGRRWTLDILEGVNTVKINGQTPNILGSDYTPFD